MNTLQPNNPLWRQLAFWMAVGFLLFDLWTATIGCIQACLQPVLLLRSPVQPVPMSEPGPDHILRLLPSATASIAASLLLVACFWRISGRGTGATGERLATLLSSRSRVGLALLTVVLGTLVLKGASGYIWAERWHSTQQTAGSRVIWWTQLLWGLQDLPVAALALLWLPRSGVSSIRRTPASPGGLDLTTRRAAWREELLYDFALPEPEVKELDSHISEAMDRAIERGSTPDQAFDLALAQLGSSETIVREFRRSNPGAIWAPRVLGMVGGCLLLPTAPWAAHTTMSLLQFASIQLLGPAALNGMFGSMTLAVWVPMVLTCAMWAGMLWMVASGRLATWGRRSRGWVQRVGWIPACIALGMTAMMWLQTRSSSGSNLAWEGAGMTSVAAYVLVFFGWPLTHTLLLGLLYARLSRRILPVS